MDKDEQIKKLQEALYAEIVRADVLQHKYDRVRLEGDSAVTFQAGMESYRTLYTESEARKVEAEALAVELETRAIAAERRVEELENAQAAAAQEILVLEK